MRIAGTVFTISIMLVAVCSFIILLSQAAHAWDLIPTRTVYSEKFTVANGPTDIIFESRDNWLLYSAADGALTQYNNTRKRTVYASDTLLGGICFMEFDGSYFFCDSAHNVLLELDDRYRVVNTVTTGNEAFDPTDITRVSESLYYIVDNDNHQVHKYNPFENSFVSSIGTIGTERGYLRYPFSAVVDSDGLLYITEVLNTRIQMFSPLGRSTFSIGEWGVSPGQLYRPKGLALVDNRYLVVSDGYLGVLQVFSVYGDFIGVLTDRDGAIKRYPSPTRIRAFGNRIAVLDYWDHTLEVFDIEGLR